MLTHDGVVAQVGRIIFQSIRNQKKRRKKKKIKKNAPTIRDHADFRIRSRSELFTPFYRRMNGTITLLDFLDRSCYGKSLTNAVERRQHTHIIYIKYIYIYIIYRGGGIKRETNEKNEPTRKREM